MAVIITATALSIQKIRNLAKENSRLLNNQDILLCEMRNYKISDSLNAAEVSELRFTLKEYKKYRAGDLQLIKQLQIKKSNLEKIISSQTETINGLAAKINDSISTRIDTANEIEVRDTIKHFSYKSKWTDVYGYISGDCDSVHLQIRNRESLKIVETVVYRRFLGFLWRTKKIKDKQITVVSENPNTVIVNSECVSIEW